LCPAFALVHRRRFFSDDNRMLLRLGVRILLEIFKVHESVRNEILEQILSRVVRRAHWLT
jgi:hypothetical protein